MDSSGPGPNQGYQPWAVLGMIGSIVMFIGGAMTAYGTYEMYQRYQAAQAAAQTATQPSFGMLFMEQPWLLIAGGVVTGFGGLLITIQKWRAKMERPAPPPVATDGRAPQQIPPHAPRTPAASRPSPPPARPQPVGTRPTAPPVAKSLPRPPPPKR